MNVKAELLSAKADAGTFAEINITPFTDVLLVLLVIFMILAALVVPPGFEKQFDKCTNTCTGHHAQLKNLDITITRAGTIRVDGSVVDATRIYSALEAYSRRGHYSVGLTADARAPYGAVIRVLDAAKESNLGAVTFVTQ